MAGQYDILADQGATLQRVIIWNQPGATPSPVNLTGFSAKMQVRPSAGSPILILELSTADGRITLGGTNGTVTLEVDAVTMAAVPAGGYKYDLYLLSGDATPVETRLIEGSFKVKAEVTIE